MTFLPGKIGREFSKSVLGLPEKRAVQIANFLGDSLNFTQTALTEEGRRLPVLWLAGHPSKLAKVLDGVWDTHSSKSSIGNERGSAGRGRTWFLRNFGKTIGERQYSGSSNETIKNGHGLSQCKGVVDRYRTPHRCLHAGMGARGGADGRTPVDLHVNSLG